MSAKSIAQSLSIGAVLIFFASLVTAFLGHLRLSIELGLLTFTNVIMVCYFEEYERMIRDKDTPTKITSFLALVLIFVISLSFGSGALLRQSWLEVGVGGAIAAASSFLLWITRPSPQKRQSAT